MIECVDVCHFHYLAMCLYTRDVKRVSYYNLDISCLIHNACVRYHFQRINTYNMSIYDQYKTTMDSRFLFQQKWLPIAPTATNNNRTRHMVNKNLHETVVNHFTSYEFKSIKPLYAVCVWTNSNVCERTNL